MKEIKVLVVVDMQNDFVTGALRNEEAIKIVPDVVNKVKNATLSKDTLVIFTQDTHKENYMETQEGKNLPVPHCIEGTEGWEIINELKPFVTFYNDESHLLLSNPFSSNFIESIWKRARKFQGVPTGTTQNAEDMAKNINGTKWFSLRKGTFGSVTLGEELRDFIGKENIEKIEFIGLCTDICVLSNATLVKAFLPEVPIEVDATCCAGVTPESHDTALNAMKAIQIKVTGQGKEAWR